MLAILRRANLIVNKGESNVSALARALGVNRACLYVWQQVPPKYTIKLEKITGGKIRRWQVRPDLWERD